MHFDQIKRREFITLLGGAAAAWPRAAHAQQPERLRRIGVLSNLAEDDPESKVRIAAFLKVMERLGWNDGRNVKIDYRWAAGSADRYPKYAAELITLAPEVILAVTTPAVMAVRAIGPTVAIVFVNVIDPVGSGLVSSLARPGGSATGFTVFEYAIAAKWLQLLKEIAPRVTRVSVLRDTSRPVRGHSNRGASARRPGRYMAARRTRAASGADNRLSQHQIAW
jgi:putative ABC transport system substrate-binding protein